MDVSQLSEEKTKILNQFRVAVSDYSGRDDFTDNHLLKWLIARDFNLVKAEAMFRRSMEWREENEIDDLVDQWQPPEVLKKYYAMGEVGFDKYGCNVWIDAFGRTDTRGLLKSVSKKDYIRYITYMAEKSHRTINPETGKRCARQTIIMDMDQLSYYQVSNPTFAEIGIETTRLTQNNYPEGVRKVFLINAPRIFAIAFAIVKPLLSEATLNKIRIFGFNRSEWQAALLEEIDSDQLPAYYGGSMTDPDGNPMCLTKINWGGEVPKSYYIEDQGNELKDGEKMATSGGGERSLLNIFTYSKFD